MNTRFTLATVAAIVAATVCGCSSSKQAAGPLATSEPQQMEQPVIGGESSTVARAVIYRTSAPADSLVPVGVRGGKIVSYPAPSDLTEQPMSLSDGWLLDTRGINPDTKFTNYTYSAYKALATAPTPDQLLESIIPDIEVTDIVVLPEAAGAVKPAEVEEIIRAGFPGCKIILQK